MGKTLENTTINARRIAELLWGRGGTIAYKTNRKGTYYYSCSAHGGYVVDGRVLTETEKAKINRHVKPETLNFLVDSETNEVYGVSYNTFTCYGKRNFKYPAGKKVEWKTVEVYTFEEDCAWAVLELYTNIRAAGSVEVEQPNRAEEAVNRYFENKNVA
jgi:hypothetical protein